jgi:putative ABC transport system ATP-binding protein
VPAQNGVWVDLEGVVRVHRRGEVEVKALDGATLSVTVGELVAVVGPSGSGKSTLLHLLGGLDTATSGRVCVAGRDLTGLSAGELTRFRRDEVGFVFQFFNLLPAMTAWENVALPALLAGQRLARLRPRAEELLALVGLADRRSHRPAELSGGQLQRVAIARALFLDPPLLLADEPTGNLDSHAAAEVVSLLAALRSEGRTIVTVTHDPSVAAAADRRISLRDGRVVDG